MAERILLVDDEDKQRVPLRRILVDWGYEVDDCNSIEAAMARIWKFLPSVVITDLVMPGGSGIDLLRQIRGEFRGSVIVLSGKGTISQAVEAMKEGADDYLEKPLDFRRLRMLLDKARGKSEILEENRRLREQLTHGGTFGRLRGVSKKMLEVYSIIEQVAPSQIPVLITGESGTGKELVARTMHELSSRRTGPYVAINAAAIPRELIESELFGHERGAFTGAIGRKIGCFEMAHQGTLFLDEIAEMEENTQAKLLRVLQEQNFRRIGGSEVIQSDVRVLAATNRDPKVAMSEKKLRKDLYYRLAVITIHLPPLRERADDIVLLAWSFVEEVCGAAGRRPPKFDQETKSILMKYRWPGNVRELRNTIERALVLASGPTILPEHLPSEVLSETGYQGISSGSAGSRAMQAALEANPAASFREAASAREPIGAAGAAAGAGTGAGTPAGAGTGASGVADAGASTPAITGAGTAAGAGTGVGAERMSAGRPDAGARALAASREGERRHPGLMGAGDGDTIGDDLGTGTFPSPGTGSATGTVRLSGTARPPGMGPSSGAPGLGTGSSAPGTGTHAPVTGTPVGTVPSLGPVPAPVPESGPMHTFTVPLGVSAAEVERELIRRTLEMTRGNKTRAAKILGLSLKTIHNKAKKYGL